MTKPQKKIRYFLYARKSSDDTQRQMAYIGDQVAHLKAHAERNGLDVVGEPLTEACTAKKPGRPVFNDMLARIERGEANGILCWDIDRLGRNPRDTGKTQWPF